MQRPIVELEEAADIMLGYVLNQVWKVGLSCSGFMFLRPEFVPGGLIASG